ncbi:MAG: glutamate synthase-related protein [Nitrososphaerales archaeon]
MFQAAQQRLIDHYINLPKQTLREFWTTAKIRHIRRLAESGRATRIWTPEDELSKRPLDRLRFKPINEFNTGLEVDTTINMGGGITLSTPLYLGDMSFGSLSGIANIAIAMAAELTETLAGTGEGGLHPEVAKVRRIAVQWASARFGVDANVLNRGLAVVIKIGQGAKPGIGGHLPAAKVTEPISMTRRIPLYKDAISPAPHHDIYSIEDLGQRIEAIKELTGKPVFVKVGATNYVQYIATGIARMGGDGIILDGAGAGTGAAPTVVRDNIGIPIEIAVASVDKILRREGLRENFTVIAGGRVSNPEDAAKLMALGADCVSVGTAALIALGCVMCHKCHLGYCPALLTNKALPSPPRMLSLDWAVQRLVNFVKGWNEELKLIVGTLGLRRVRELVGRRDLLEAYGMWEETASILGVNLVSGCSTPLVAGEGGYWSERRRTHLTALAENGVPEIGSMGSCGPPFVEPPKAVCDYLVSDGAQVTRPSIDPYREEIEIASYLSGIRLSAPIFFSHFKSLPKGLVELFAKVAKAHGLMMYTTLDEYDERLAKYAGNLMLAVDDPMSIPENVGVVVIDAWRESKPFRENVPDKPLYVRIHSSEQSLTSIQELARRGFDGIIIDTDLTYSPATLDVAVMTAEADWSLREVFYGGSPVRNQLNLLCGGSAIRGADDIFKLLCLGADAVGLNRAALVAIGYEEGRDMNLHEARVKLENFILGLKGEIRLLAGAAGVSSIYTSLVGNRELLRSVDLDPAIRSRLKVKAAGT